MFLLLFIDLHFTTHLEDNPKRDKDEKKIEMMIGMRVSWSAYSRSWMIEEDEMKKRSVCYPS